MLKCEPIKHIYKVYVICDQCKVQMLLHDTDLNVDPPNYIYKCKHCGYTETAHVISGENMVEIFSPLELMEGDNV